MTPPVHISWTASTNGFLGRVSRGVTHEPKAQKELASSTIAAPASGTWPSSRPPRTSHARPAKPSSTPTTDHTRGQSPVMTR